MKMKPIIAIFFLALWLLCPTGVRPLFASDLDDGISKYTDDGIAKNDELGTADININFIKMDAKSRAKVRARKGEDAADNGGNIDAGGGMQGVGALNSVILGAGGTIKGDVIIIDESKGDKIQIVE